MTHVYLPNINVAFTDNNGLLTETAYRFLISLWERTGGHDDTVDATDNNQYFWDSTSAFLSGDYVLVTTSVDYTTQGNMLIVVTGQADIYLNNNAADKETVIIKRAFPNIPVNVYADAIDGSTSYQMIVNYEAIHCVYSIENASWYIV